MNHKRFVRISALVLAFVLVLGVAAMGITAMAASGDTLYFKPSANWKEAGARFAAYFFGGATETWVSMTDSDGDGIYECTVPGSHASVIFVRMNGSTTENNWNNKWNQTADLTIPADGKNCFAVNEGEWDGAQGTWSTVESDNSCAHEWGTGTITTEVTCEKNGVKTYTCSLCGNTKTESIVALGHNYVDGTCDRCGDVQAAARVIYFVNTDGWTTVNAYAWNSTSNEKFLGEWPGTAMNKVEGDLYSITVSGEATHIIFNNGGDQTPDLELSTEYNRYTWNGSWDYLNNCEHTYNSGVVTTQPSCTTEGEKTFTCSLCGHTKTEVVAALGHLYINGVCGLCGAAEPCDHLWDNGSTTTAATCTTNGEKTYTCRKCSETKTEVITATGHKYSDGVCYNCGEKEPVIEYVDIANVSDLIAFANRVNAGETTLNGRLVANIDLKGASWTPIGIYCPGGDVTKSVFFRGIFNGNGYTVSNFTVSGTDCVGLFGYAEMATIMNLGVINATMTGWNAGAICGYAPTATIINCYAIGCNITGNTTNPIAINSEAVHVGAIAGSNAGTVKNCYAVNCTLSTKFVGQFNSMSPLGGVICSNNYYSNVSGAFTNTAGATSVTAAQLSSGEVAYKLQSSQAEAVWGQKIGTDSYPVIFGATVFEENGQYTNNGDVHSHNYTGKVTTEPTCEADGVKTFTCSGCGDSYTEVIPSSGHNYVGGVCTNCGAADPNACDEHTWVYKFENQIHTFTCSECGKVVTGAAAAGEKKFAMTGAAPVLKDDIVIKIGVRVPTGFSDVYAVVNFHGEDYYYYGDVENDAVTFAFDKICPMYVGDTFKTTIYATFQGQTVSICKESYSMLEYAVGQLNKTNISANLRTALSDLLVYAEKAQLYFDWNTENLVTEGLDAVMTPTTYVGPTAEQNKQALVGDKSSVVDFRGATVMLQSKIVLRYSIKTADPYAQTYKITVAGATYEFTGDDLVLQSETATDMYYLYFDVLKATQFDETIVCAFYDGETQIGRSAEYSVNTYVYQSIGKAEGELKDVLMALYNYGEAARNI